MMSYGRKEFDYKLDGKLTGSILHLKGMKVLVVFSIVAPVIYCFAEQSFQILYIIERNRNYYRYISHTSSLE